MVNMNALTTPSNPDERKNGTGQWKKGASGNPKGRPLGSRNKATLRLEQLLDEEGEVLLTDEIARAREGDRYARRFCLDRLIPRPKDRPIDFELGPTETYDQLRAAVTNVLDAVASGQVPPNQGQVIMTMLKFKMDIVLNVVYCK